MNGNNRANIKVGMLVMVVEKQNQRTNVLTKGYVERILTNSKFHPHGIKVRLDSGVAGRVKEIIEE